MFLNDPKNSLNTRKSPSGAFVVDTGGDQVGMDIDLRREEYCPTLYVGTSTPIAGRLHVLTADETDVTIQVNANGTHVPLQVITVYSDTTQCENITALY